jgi:hypothetical protein
MYTTRNKKADFIGKVFLGSLYTIGFFTILILIPLLFFDWRIPLLTHSDGMPSFFGYIFVIIAGFGAGAEKYSEDA